MERVCAPVSVFEPLLWKNLLAFGATAPLTRRATGERGVKQQREFFAKRLYISDNADLARLCLAIIAPVSPGHQDFEDVLHGLERARKGYRMSKNSSQLLRLWIREFQAGKRSTNARLAGDYWKIGSMLPLTDSHFIGSVFRSFSHQCSIDGRRIGGADCTNLRAPDSVMV